MENRRFLALTLAVCLCVHLPAEAKNTLSRMAIFGFIGLPAPLLDHFVSSDTCANARERNAGAAAACMLGMGAGALGGFLMGSGGDRDSWIDGGVGAVLGGIAGRAIANAAVDQAAGLAGRGAE